MDSGTKKSPVARRKIVNSQLGSGKKNTHRGNRWKAAAYRRVHELLSLEWNVIKLVHLIRPLISTIVQKGFDVGLMQGTPRSQLKRAYQNIWKDAATTMQKNNMPHLANTAGKRE